MLKFNDSHEKNFYYYGHQNQAKLLTIQAAVIVLIICGFSLADIIDCGFSKAVVAILTIRVFLIFMVCQTVAFLLQKSYVGVNREIFVFLICFLLMVDYFAVIKFHTIYYYFNLHSIFVLMSGFYILSYFLLMPVYHHWLQLVAGSVFMLAVIVHLSSNNLQVEVEENIVLVCLSFLITYVCALFAVKSNVEKKKISGKYFQEKEIKKKLAQDLLLKEKLFAAERAMLAYETELKLLNAQIKPHFLFNVIGTAAILCKNSPELAAKMLDNLAVYLKSRVQLNKEFINLSDELNVVQSYLDIQSVRMGERLQYEIRRQFSHDIMLPVFVIQTLVENAVIHGLQNSDEGGSVIVLIKEDNDSIQVSVQDNGIGMEQKKLEQIFSDKQVENSLSGHCNIGLWNVNRRLQLSGKSTGLQFSSAIGKGTIASFEIKI